MSRVERELAEARQRVTQLEAENAALRDRDKKQRAHLKLAQRMLKWRAEAHARHDGAEQMQLGLDPSAQAALELVAEADERADQAEADRDRDVAAAQHRQKIAERRTQVLQTGLELVIDTERESRSKVRHASDRPLLRQLAVIAEVARCADLDGHCWHTQEDLGAVLDVSADTIRRDLAGLGARIHVGPAYCKDSPLRRTQPALWRAGRRKQAWRRQILTLLPHGNPELLDDLGLPARGADGLSKLARKVRSQRDSARHRDADSLYIVRGSEVSTKRRARGDHHRDLRNAGDRARAEYRDAMDEFSDRMAANPDARRYLEHIRDKAVRAWERIEDKRWRHGRPVHQELRELFLIEAQLQHRPADELVEQLEAYATSVRWGIAPFALPLAVVLRPGGALEHRWRRTTQSGSPPAFEHGNPFGPPPSPDLRVPEVEPPAVQHPPPKPPLRVDPSSDELDELVAFVDGIGPKLGPGLQRFDGWTIRFEDAEFVLSTEDECAFLRMGQSTELAWVQRQVDIPIRFELRSVARPPDNFVRSERRDALDVAADNSVGPEALSAPPAYERTTAELREAAAVALYGPYRDALLAVADELEELGERGGFDAELLKLVDEAVVTDAMARMCDADMAALEEFLDVKLREMDADVRRRSRHGVRLDAVARRKEALDARAASAVGACAGVGDPCTPRGFGGSRVDAVAGSAG